MLNSDEGQVGVLVRTTVVGPLTAHVIAALQLLLQAQGESVMGGNLVSVDLVPDGSGLPYPTPLLDDADRAEQARLQGEGIKAMHVAVRISAVKQPHA
jgi:hypothetical protein